MATRCSGVLGIFRIHLLAGLVLGLFCCTVGLAAAVPLSLASCADAKLTPDGGEVAAVEGVVSAVSGEVFYVQSPDRCTGLRVLKTGHSAARDTLVRLDGRMSTAASGERTLLATQIGFVQEKVAVPLGLGTAAVGGGDWFYHSGDGSGQRRAAGGIGLSNVGLLVRVAGYISDVSADEFRVRDGSAAAGLRVKTVGSTPPPEGAYAVVTGISSLSETPAGEALLVPRDSGDIVPLGGTLAGQVTRSGAAQVAEVVDSGRPYPDNTTQSWTISRPGVSRIRVHFYAIGLDVFDSLELQDAYGYVQQEFSWNVTGMPLVDIWSQWVQGDSVTLSLKTEDLWYLEARYGFVADAWRYDGPPVPLEGVTVLLQPGGRKCVTGPDGRYSFGALSPETYTIVPQQQGFSFAPDSLMMPVSGDDYVSGLDFQRL